MSKYFMEGTGWQEDGLIGGLEEPVRIHNASLASGAEVHRGELLCATNGTYSIVAGAADASKPLAIAVSDFTADSIQAVTQVYTSGTFNKEKIIMPEGVDVETFRQSLRTQNIHLTSVKEN